MVKKKKKKKRKAGEKKKNTAYNTVYSNSIGTGFYKIEDNIPGYKEV